MFDYFLVFTASVTFIGFVVWAIRLEGKVTAHDQLFIERKQQTEASEEAFDDRLTTSESSIDARLTELKADLKERLVRIESKLDTIAYGAAFAPKP